MMIPKWPILALIAAILSVAWALVSASRRKGVAIGVAVVGLLMLLMVASGPVLFEWHRARPPAIGQQPGSVAAVPTSVDVEWTGDSFDADVYPSFRSAMRNLASRLAGPINTIRQARDGATAFRIISPPAEPAFEELWPHLNQAILEQFPNADCSVERQTQQPELEQPENAIRLTIDIEAWRRQAVPWMSRKAFSGTIRATASAARTQPAVATVRIEEKPWADSTADFINADPRRWIVGRSLGPCPSEREAADQSLRSASAALFPLVRYRITRTGPVLSADEQWLHQQVQARVAQGFLVADRFAQAFQRPYGTVWREAVLLDASSGKVDELARELSRELARRTAHQRGTVLSVSALALVVFLVYLFANAATKGYFVWSLRSAAVVILLAGIVILILLL